MNDSIDYFYHDTPSRMMGSETEYTTPFNARQYGNLENRVPKESISYAQFPNSLWLRNGGRLYLECNDIVEYATPECTTAEEVMVYEKAGESEIKNLTTHLRTTQPAYKRSGYVSVHDANARQIITLGGTGHHENYQTPIDVHDSSEYDSACALESYLSTRAIWAGAGIVGPYGYEISQKARDTTDRDFDPTSVTNLTVSGHKPIFRGRINDRFEVRLGDGNMSPWAIRTKYAMTSFVLRLIEHGCYPESLLIEDNGYLRRYVSQAPNAVFETLTGAQHTAATHQQAIARACLDFSARNPRYTLDNSEIRAALDIETFAPQIDRYFMNERDPDLLIPLAERIDYAAKLHLMHQHGFNDATITTKNLDAVKYDLRTERVARSTELTRWYDRVGNNVPSQLVENARTTAPSGRPRWRVNTVRKTIREGGTIDDLNYEYIQITTSDGNSKILEY